MSGPTRFKKAVTVTLNSGLSKYQVGLGLLSMTVHLDTNIIS